MINIPEIDSFFSKNRFTPEELDELANQLKATYNHREIIKVKQYVDLKLLSYTLVPINSFSDEKRNIDLKQTISRSAWYGLIKKKNKYYLKDLSVHLEIPENEIRDIIYMSLGIKVSKTISFGQMVKCSSLFRKTSEKYKSRFDPSNYNEKRKLSVERLAKELNWTSRELQSMIYEVTGKRYVRHLGKNELTALKPVIDQRKIEIKSIHRKNIHKIKVSSQNKKTKQKWKLSELDKGREYHVYDKIQKVGGVGKLIYIRSK